MSSAPHTTRVSLITMALLSVFLTAVLHLSVLYAALSSFQAPAAVLNVRQARGLFAGMAMLQLVEHAHVFPVASAHGLALLALHRLTPLPRTLLVLGALLVYCGSLITVAR